MLRGQNRRLGLERTSGKVRRRLGGPAPLGGPGCRTQIEYS